MIDNCRHAPCATISPRRNENRLDYCPDIKRYPNKRLSFGINKRRFRPFPNRKILGHLENIPTRACKRLADRLLEAGACWQ